MVETKKSVIHILFQNYTLLVVTFNIALQIEHSNSCRYPHRPIAKSELKNMDGRSAYIVMGVIFLSMHVLAIPS